MLQIIIGSLVVTCALALSCSLDPDNEAEHTDVLILGAGIAGIAAARTLEVNGINNFLVIEATDRIGGRIREYDGTNIEVGANWIHGLDLEDLNHHPIWREWVACDEDGPDGSVTPDLTHVYDQTGIEIDIEDENGRFVNRTEAFYAAYEAAEELEVTVDTSFRQALTMGGWELEDRLDNFIEWEHIDLCIGVRPENISFPIYYQLSAYTDFTESDNETEDYLIVDDKGYSFVVKCMARNFENDRVKLNSYVRKIQTADDCVCATVQDGEVYCGRYGIVTFSSGALQAAVRGDDNSVEFDPPLPQSKQDAINSATPIHYGKAFLIFNTTFWDETDEIQQTLGYVSDERGYYGYYVLDRNRPNTITVDVVDDLSLRVARQSEEETVSEIMTILRKIYGDNIPEPHTAIISRWPTDPLFLSAYTAYGPGVPASIFDDLLEPVNERLYFAGEALNSTHYGFTPGGYGSGAYVAKQISAIMSGE